MKIQLIAPRYISYAGLKDVYNQQKLTLMYLAALTPEEFNVEIIDEDVKEISYNNKPDLVAISFNSPTSFRAFEIATKFKSMGVPVVCGGFHTSLFPEKVLEYADSIVIGEAEYVWKDLLNDFKNKKLKKIYKSNKICDLKNIPFLKYECYNPSDFYNQFPLFITRGCPFTCSYCCIKTVYGNKFRKRPVDDVIKNIEYIIKKYSKPGPIPLTLCFVDDNIWGDIKYAKELFKKMIPLKISWYAQGASLNLDDETLELAAQSGCICCFVGLESLIPENLKYLNKKQNDINFFESFIKKIHNLNIAVGAYFMLGLPYDNESIFIDLFDFLEKNQIELPALHIYTPIPGTEEYEKHDWPYKENHVKNFNTITNALPIYHPKNMTKKDFRKGFVDFTRKLFSDQSIEKRFINCTNFSVYTNSD